MRKEANLKQWKDLYEVAIKLKEMKPWKKLWDMDLITILTSDTEEPTMCSVMGRGGECFGIGVYVGIEAIHGFFQMARNQDMSSEQLIRYQNNLSCFFGDRSELNAKELKLIKDLDLKFRGRNQWIYFKVFDSIHVPHMPEERDVLKLTEMLRHLYMALKAMNNGITVDFEHGNMLLRRFDAESKLWLNHEAPVFIPDVQYKIPILQDELLIKKISNQKVVNSKLELDIAYLNSYINGKEYDTPIMSRLCILADRRAGLILDQVMITPDMEDVDVVFDILINFIMQRGRPKAIIVRDEYLQSLLLDLCERTGIDLKVQLNLQLIDNFLDSFSSMRF